MCVCVCVCVCVVHTIQCISYCAALLSLAHQVSVELFTVNLWCPIIEG